MGAPRRRLERELVSEGFLVDLEHQGGVAIHLDELGVNRDGQLAANLLGVLGVHAKDGGVEAAALLELDLETGYEAYLITPMPLLEAKRIAVNIEDTHPLGRLFDIDIINADGVPVSRDAIGEKPRRCLVCDHEARYCMRMRWHTQEEIWAKINEMVDSYVEARKS